MPRAARLLLLALTAIAALALAGCGNKEQEGETIVAETEGIYVNVDGLTYQVQLSRILNPADIEDAAFLRGTSEGVAPGKDEVWFGIFMRVQNESKSETFRTADTFEMEDTAGLTLRAAQPRRADQRLRLRAGSAAARRRRPGADVAVLGQLDPGLAAALQGEGRVALQPAGRAAHLQHRQRRPDRHRRPRHLAPL